MPGVRAPQPPSSGPPASYNRRRRHSLPALSSAQLNRLSANASKKQGDGDNLSKSLPEKTTSRKDETNAEEGITVKGDKCWKSGTKLTNSTDSKSSGKSNSNDKDVKLNNDTANITDSINRLSVYNGSSTLQSKIQSSKSNAVFVFRFEEEDDKSTSPDSKTDAPEKQPSVFSSTPPGHPTSRKDESWSGEAVECRNAYNVLLRSSEFDAMGFCGVKHKRFRESGKLYMTMSPVLELNTPTDETEYESEDEWLSVSSSDYWTDARSSTSTNSPKLSREKDLSGRLRLSVNGRPRLREDGDGNATHSLRAALSLSPRRSSASRNPVVALRRMNQRNQEKPSPPRSPLRGRRQIRRGSLDSAVGHIFQNLQSPSSLSPSSASTSNSKLGSSSSSTSSSNSSLSSSSSVSSSSSTSTSVTRSGAQTVSSDPALSRKPHIYARRSSLGTLPDLVNNAKDIDHGVSRRRSLLVHNLIH